MKILTRVLSQLCVALGTYGIDTHIILASACRCHRHDSVPYTHHSIVAMAPAQRAQNSRPAKVTVNGPRPYYFYQMLKVRSTSIFTRLGPCSIHGFAHSLRRSPICVVPSNFSRSRGISKCMLYALLGRDTSSLGAGTRPSDICGPHRQK
ncbi:hypothetical protein DENSPDRAFT_616921 [Dentipellis sp. KUC8613]|nr:hypothetical protein DENSPDRAFT_616921 [Dentipellis sp. KUC8613]